MLYNFFRLVNSVRIIEESRIMKKLIFSILTLSCILFFSLKSQSQKVYSIGVTNLLGKNVNKTSDREFGSTHPNGIEIYYHRWHDGAKHWEKVYNYPHTGWALAWIDHRNNTLGHSFVLNRYLDCVFWRKKSFECYLKLSQGIMFSTTIYKNNSSSKNEFNNAISQRINFSEQLGLGVYFYPINYLTLNLGATINHFSNGAHSQPNDGLNLLCFNVGLAYTSARKPITFNKNPETITENRSVKVNINFAGGYKQLTPENEKKYPLATLNVYVDKKIARVSALNLGADLFLNYGVKYSVANNAKYKGADFKRMGIVFGHELFINKIALLTQVGHHVYSPYPSLSNFYQKVGLKYYLTDNLFIGFTLRSFRFSISDEIAWGIGVRL